MVIKYFFPLLLLSVLSLAGCKKDNGEEEEEEQWVWEDNYIEYDGKQYEIKKGRMWDYKFNRYPSHYTYAFFMLNGKSFPQDGDYDLEPGDPPISLFYYLSVPQSVGYFAGDFEYLEIGEDDWVDGLPSGVQEKNVMTFAVVGFDANNNRRIEKSEVIKVTGGKVNSGGGNETYDLKLENGKTLKGKVDVTLAEQLPPS